MIFWKYETFLAGETSLLELDEDFGACTGVVGFDLFLAIKKTKKTFKKKSKMFESSIVDVEIPEELKSFVEIEDAIWALNKNNVDDVILKIAKFLEVEKDKDHIKEIIRFHLSNVMNARLGLSKQIVKIIKKFINEIPVDKVHYHLLSPIVQFLLVEEGIIPEEFRKYCYQSSVIFEEGTIHNAIFEDDIESLTNYIAKNSSFNVNMKIRFHRTIMPLICHCAIFGSIECFKYLLMNGAVIDKFVAHSSVSEGNMEIIRICEQSGMDFSEYLNTAILSHQNNIADWIILNYETKLFSFNDALLSLNSRALFFLRKVTEFDCTGNTVLSSCIPFVTQGCLDFMKYFSKTENVNSIIDDCPIIQIALTNNYFEAADILIENGAQISADIILELINESNTRALIYLKKHKIDLDKKLSDGKLISNILKESNRTKYLKIISNNIN